MHLRAREKTTVKKSVSVNQTSSRLIKRTFSKQHQFANEIALKKESVDHVYRGIKPTDKFSVFSPASVIVGLPSRKAFKQSYNVRSIDIAIHKDSNNNEGYNYYLSSSADASITSVFGLLHLTIDATHPQKWIDVESTYLNVCNQYAEHAEENENTTLAILTAATKSITDNKTNEVINNPFYLPINLNNVKISRKYEDIYALYCELLLKSNPSHPEYNAEALSTFIKQYTHELIKLYNVALGMHSPFNLTLPQFANKFPAYTKEMSGFLHPQFSSVKFFKTAHSPKRETLSEVFERHCVSLFRKHPYIEVNHKKLK